MAEHRRHRARRPPQRGRGDAGAPISWRMIAIWAVLSAVADLLFYFLAGPHIPPGTMTSTADGQQFDFNVLFMIALPVMLAVWVYMGYALWTWRASRGGPEPVAGPDSRGHLGIQIGWISATTRHRDRPVRLRHLRAGRAGRRRRRRGAEPALDAASHNVLPIQVIAQQWKFTYRYPTFGGFETADLVIPADTTIAFHVTSLDVIHSFWAYQLGVKADANPGLGQRGLHQDHRPAGPVHRALRRAVRPLARRHVQHRAGGERAGLHGLGQVDRDSAGRRPPSSCPRSRGRTSPTPTGPTAATTPTTRTPTATWRRTAHRRSTP